MKRPVVFRPDAVDDVCEARDYYERQRPGLGFEFTNAVDETVSQIASNPELFATVLREVRRTKLQRFPYVAYFRIIDERIEILALIHGSRHPRTRRQRV